MALFGLLKKKKTEEEIDEEDNLESDKLFEIVAQLVQESKNLYEKKDYKNALSFLFKAENLDPNNPHILNFIAAIFSDVEMNKESIEYADRALKIDPNSIQALNNKGTALEGLGKFEEAIKCYEQALKINPKYIKALHNKGRALKILGKYKEAIKYFDMVLKIDPHYKAAIYHKSETLETMGKFEESRMVSHNRWAIIAEENGKKFDKNDKKLLEISKKVVTLANEFKEIIILHSKANDLIKLHKYPEALNDFDKAVILYKKKKVTPKNKDFGIKTYVNLLNDKGIALSKMQKHKEAISCYNEALRISPHDETILNNKKHTLEKLKNE